MGFGVKQKRLNSVEEAVAATIELESYLSAPGRSAYHCVDSVAPQQSAGDLGGEALAAPREWWQVQVKNFGGHWQN